MALLIVLDKMSPAERVSFVLHDVFQYSFAEIAEMVGRTPHACRQLASSARKRVKTATIGRVDHDEHRRINQAFKDAWQEGSLKKLLNVLDPSVTAVTDGGGLVSAAIDPLVGAEQVATFFKAVMLKQPNLNISEAVVNYQPGLIGSAHGRVIAVVATQITMPRISNIWAIRNPEKLRLWHNELPEGDDHVLPIA
ncbi:RNA polymerase sigma factor SigJ [Brevibacterium iodinum]|nr:sigma factor-like helix-turn-helix DNA-binding protein [Brevibacterium iodinum]SUW70201.1 RNA polymerase sigma factor SigJ [Brevibacterium iodinum]